MGHNSFRVVQINDGKFTLGRQLLEKRVCGQISQTYKWILRLTWMCIVSFDILAMTFYMVNVYLQNAYTVTFGSAIFWFALFPAHLFYMTYSILGLQMYIIASSRIIRIRQDSLHAKLVHLNTYQSVNSQKAHQMASRKWRQNLKLNLELVNICQHIVEYRRQNRPLLSVLVPYLMLMICYTSTVALSGDRQNQPFCLLAISDCTALLYLITHECAQIDTLNGFIEREMRHFYLNCCSESKTGNKKRRLPIGTKLKAEAFQNTDRLVPYVFTLFGNCRITSKTFHSIFVYTSSYFMFLFKGGSPEEI